MSAGLKGIRLAVIGGDDRELYLIPELQKQGAYIVGVGFENASPIPGMTLAPSLQDVVGQVDVLLFPMFGTDERGVVKAKYSASPIVLKQRSTSSYSSACSTDNWLGAAGFEVSSRKDGNPIGRNHNP